MGSYRYRSLIEGLYIYIYICIYLTGFPIIYTLNSPPVVSFKRILAQVGSHLHPLAAHAPLRLEEDSLRAPPPRGRVIERVCMHACMTYFYQDTCRPLSV